MKIYPDKKKINKRIISFGFVALLLLFCLVMLISAQILEGNEFNTEKWIVLIALCLFLMFWLPLLVFYIRMKKSDSWIIRYENGILDDVSKPFNRATKLKIENIVSVTHWSSTKGINQYKIITTNHDPNRKGITNQVKGGHFYLTDYVVDSKELYELAKRIGEASSKKSFSDLV